MKETHLIGSPKLIKKAEKLKKKKKMNPNRKPKNSNSSQMDQKEKYNALQIQVQCLKQIIEEQKLQIINLENKIR